MTTIRSARIIRPSALLNIPKGKYKGKWGGYVASAIINGEMFEFSTQDGIRGIDIKCIISITEDSATVEVER